MECLESWPKIINKPRQWTCWYNLRFLFLSRIILHEIDALRSILSTRNTHLPGSAFRNKILTQLIRMSKLISTPQCNSSSNYKAIRYQWHDIVSLEKCFLKFSTLICFELSKSQLPSTCWVPSTRKMTDKDGRRRVWSKRFAVFCRFQQTDTRWAEVGVRGSNSRSFVDRTIVQPFDVRWYIVVIERFIDDTWW